MQGIDPWAHLADVLSRVQGHHVNRTHQLTPMHRCPGDGDWWMDTDSQPSSSALRGAPWSSRCRRTIASASPGSSTAARTVSRASRLSASTRPSMLAATSVGIKSRSTSRRSFPSPSPSWARNRPSWVAARVAARPAPTQGRTPPGIRSRHAQPEPSTRPRLDVATRRDRRADGATSGPGRTPRAARRGRWLVGGPLAERRGRARSRCAGGGDGPADSGRSLRLGRPRSAPYIV